MLIDECIRDLQKYTIEKITYDKIAKALGLKGKQSISNRIARKQALKDSEIKLIYDYFKVDKSKDDDCITLEHISINPSCGKGTEIMDEPDITPVQIGINLIKTIFKISQPKNLKTFIAAGDSMNPPKNKYHICINNKTYLLVNTKPARHFNLEIKKEECSILKYDSFYIIFSLLNRSVDDFFKIIR